MDPVERVAAARGVHAGGHPSWCDRSLCTAAFDALAEDGWSHKGGYHLSAPMVVGDTRSGAVGVTLRLKEAVAPWMCETYLDVVPKGKDGGARLGEAAEAVEALAELSDVFASVGLRLESAEAAAVELGRLVAAGRAAQDAAVQRSLQRQRRGRGVS